MEFGCEASDSEAAGRMSHGCVWEAEDTMSHAREMQENMNPDGCRAEVGEMTGRCRYTAVESGDWEHVQAGGPQDIGPAAWGHVLSGSHQDIAAVNWGYVHRVKEGTDATGRVDGQVVLDHTKQVVRTSPPSERRTWSRR